MKAIKSELYRCSNKATINPQRWWTEPMRDPQNRDVYYLCGGNEPSNNGAGKGSSTCTKINTASCNTTILNTSMTVARQALQPVCLKTGSCFLFGGNTLSSTDETRSVDRFDLNKGLLFQNMAKLSEPRLAYIATELDNGKILITGGYGVKDPKSGMGQVYNTAILFNPRDGKSINLRMTHQRGAHTITKLNDGTYLLIGGNGSDPSGAEIFDPNTNKFIPIKSKMQGGRKDHRAILASNGKIYVIGGTMGSSAPTAIEIYDSATRQFTDSGLKLSQGREDTAVVYISVIDAIVAVGGEIKGAQSEPESKAIDVIDIKNNKVISGFLKTPRDEPSAFVKSVDPEMRRAELLVLTGQQKRGKNEISLPAEIITIHLR